MSQAPGGASQDGLPNTQDVTDIDSCSQSQEQPANGDQGEKWGRLFPVGIRAKFDGLGESKEMPKCNKKCVVQTSACCTIMYHLCLSSKCRGSWH